MNNITSSILNKIGTDLYKQPNHPIEIIKKLIFQYFSDFEHIEINDPYVSVADNFDNLLVPKNHPSRRITDTYYKSDNTVLRTHMTCYLPILGKTKNNYVVCGDVYRKDAIDASHYPIFHQMDGFCIVDDKDDVKLILRDKIIGLVKFLFGNDIKYKILEDYDHSDVHFPFTKDSFEVEVELKLSTGEVKILEVLGAGTVQDQIMDYIGQSGKKAWAFGLGLERLAMILFEIPDIRLFWSKDSRFISQFNNGITKFKPYSKYEGCYKDIAMFINDNFSYNDLCSIARDEDTQNLIESIILIDEFKKKDKISHCYRITYRSMDSTLKNSDIDIIQFNIRNRLVSEFNIELR